MTSSLIMIIIIGYNAIKWKQIDSKTWKVEFRTNKQPFSQEFESGSPNFMWAEGPHSMAPAAPCYGGVWGHAPPENFEKLKPLRRDFRDSDSCKRLSIYLLNRLFIAAGKVAWGRLGKSITLNSGFACEIALLNFDSFDQNRKETR